MSEMVVCPDPDNCEPYGDHHRRAQEGRCIRCGNWPQICGHDAPFAERIKSVQLDTSWMPHAGTAGPTNRFGKDKDVVNPR